MSILGDLANELGADGQQLVDEAIQAQTAPIIKKYTIIGLVVGFFLGWLFFK